MEVIIERCCGLDVHQETVVACVLIGAPGERPRKEIRTFRTMTRDLEALRDWLQELGVTQVGMEGASSQAARCRVALIACRVGPGQANPSAARWARQSTGKRVSAISLFAVRSAGCLPPRIAATMSGAR